MYAAVCSDILLEHPPWTGKIKRTFVLTRSYGASIRVTSKTITSVYSPQRIIVYRVPIDNDAVFNPLRKLDVCLLNNNTLA